MKQQVQETGVRKWYGDDFINMQDELIATIVSTIEAYEITACILSGATVSYLGDGKYQLQPGIVYIKDSTGANGRILRIPAAVNFPTPASKLYLVQADRDRTTVANYGRLYKDGSTKNIVVEYFANALPTQPAHSNYIELTATNNESKRFRAALQTATYRFVTDSEKATWNAKYGTAGAVLSALLGVDGSGSGLDADTTDGIHIRINAGNFEFSTNGSTWTTIDASMSAADILAALLTVDGTGSGLDADLLDGNHATAFQLAADMVSTNTANKGVKRDASGNFVAGTITVTDIIIS